jgi:hypothetical protein
MTDTGKNHEEHPRDAGFRGSEDAGLDRALDVALAKYAAVEPRAGLEDRILANLRAQQTQAAPRFWWRWGLTGALAALLVVGATIAWRSSRPAPPVAHRPPVEAPAPTRRETQVTTGNHGATVHPHRRNVLASRSIHATVAVVPKLDVFPSPQPLTEQEKLLASYVDKFNDEAVIVARVRTEALRAEREQEEAEGTNHDVRER